MASITSLTGSGSNSVNSLYGNRNILTGLASGMDTESMIENSISGYKKKIQSLIQQQTKLGWKQTAYQSITDKLISLSRKYTSYTSSTNLASVAFFTNSSSVVTGGKYADLISASGKSSSDIQINSVEQLATSARYSAKATELNFKNVDKAVTNQINLNDNVKSSLIAGSITLSYGSTRFDLDFSEDDIVQNAGDLVSLIQDKLDKQNVSVGGVTYKASELVNVTEDSGNITFSDIGGRGNSVFITSASGKLSEENSPLEIRTASLGNSNMANSGISIRSGSPLVREQSAIDYLRGQSIEVTLDGVRKEVKLDRLTGNNASELAQSLKTIINDKLGGEKINVLENNGALTFEIQGNSGETLKISSASKKTGEILGLGKGGVSNYLDMGNSLESLLGMENGTLAGLSHETTDGITKDADGNYYALDDTYHQNPLRTQVESNGVTTITLGDGTKAVDIHGDGSEFMKVDNSGENFTYSMEINGVKIGGLSKESTLQDVFDAINNSDADVTASYSKLTGSISLTTKDTGANAGISFGDGLASKLFANQNYSYVDNQGYLRVNGGDNGFVRNTDETGRNFRIMEDNGRLYKIYDDANSVGPELTEREKTQYLSGGSYKAGQNAIVNASVNGENVRLEKSSNVIDMDGMKVTLQGTFNTGFEQRADGSMYVNEIDNNGNTTNNKVRMAPNTAVTFQNKMNSDNIVSAVKDFIEEYNAVMKEVREAYSTQPLEKSSTKHTKYEPLTDEDKEGMSESAIAAYEEKAKTGLLFGDTDLSSLYGRLRSAISQTGELGKMMKAIGLTTTTENGMTTISLDENKFRAALDSDPESVQKVFTNNTEYGASFNGLMSNMKKVTDAYASTSIGKYGILVQKAGATQSPLSLMNNSVQKQVDSLNKQIDSWQSKMSDKIDYYTRQFTALEKLMSQMNSQSSMLAGMMGY